MTEVGGKTREDAGATLRRIRYSGGRRVSQSALATLLGTSRAHIARLELHGSPPLTDEQLNRLQKVGDTVQPPFSREELDELRKAMQTVGTSAVEQTGQAVRDIAFRAAQIFAMREEKPSGAEAGSSGQPPSVPRPDVPAPSDPILLTTMSKVAAAAQEDIKYLAHSRHASSADQASAEPDVIITQFGARSLIEEAQEPERFRDALIEILRDGATVQYLIAPVAGDASQGLVALVPVMLYYLGQGGRRYQVHLISQPRHPLAYEVCAAGDRGLLIARGDERKAAAVRTSNAKDTAALRDLLRPYWEGKDSIIEELGRRSTETVTGRSAQASEPLRFDRVLTAVEIEDGPRRLAKNGLSILNIPVAIQAWKGRAAELCTAQRIPADLLTILQSQAWELAEQGAGQLPAAVLEQYSEDPETAETLSELDEYARSLRVRQAAWTDQLSRHDFWDACPKSALIRFMSTGELPCDEMPPTCGYKAARDDIEIIITRLITRLRTNRNYHLALIDELPFSKWFYFEVKAAHVLVQVFDMRDRGNEAVRSCDDDMLSAHIECAPIADAFAGWFDMHVLKAANDPPWQDHRRVAEWLEKKLAESKEFW